MFEESLQSGALNLGIHLTPSQIDKFLLYLKELLDWNKRINLTAITKDKEVITKHFLDSLTLSSFISPHTHLIDVGTGAGFPGIPLKIVDPTIKLTLLESVQKKVKFLEHIVSVLKLKDVEVIWGRAEDYGQKEDYRESFDLAVSRAVADLRILAEYCLPLVKIGGLFIAQKACPESRCDRDRREEKIEDELDKASAAINLLGGRIKGVAKVKLPFTNITRSLVIMEKVSSASLKYPRRAGIPSKRPL